MICLQEARIDLCAKALAKLKPKKKAALSPLLGQPIIIWADAHFSKTFFEII